MNTEKTYTQEFDTNEGSHRLVCSDGRVTEWTPYVGYAYMDGHVSCTGYYMEKEGVYSAEAFLKATAYTVKE